MLKANLIDLKISLKKKLFFPLVLEFIYMTIIIKIMISLIEVMGLSE